MMKVLFNGTELTDQCTTIKGVYCWVNTVNGKKYIGLGGGKNGIRGRLYSEVSALQKGVHKGTKLIYEAVRKYGLDKFIVYSLYETEDPSMLGNIERDFIRMYNTITPNGYNITEGGAGTIGFVSAEGAEKRRGVPLPSNSIARAKTYYLVSPSGDIVSATNLKAFCDAYGLSENAMRHLVAGRAVQHKGWKNAHNTKGDYYKSISNEAYFKSPSGEVVRVLNIKSFSKMIGVSQGALNGVWTKRKHYNSCKGWTRANQEDIDAFDSSTQRTWAHDKWENV
jgi:hypothetical protein